MKTGVIGLGFMGAAHVAAIHSDPQAQLVAIASQNPKAREGDLSGTGGNLELGNRIFDFSKVAKYNSWTELLTDSNVEAVTICLPTNLHAEVSTAALAAGKHVLCEKPMALNVADCDRMIRASNQAGRVLMIAQVLRFWPEYMALRDFATGAKHGKVRQATFIRKCGLPSWSQWLPDESLSGGALMDLLIHDIDQILLLFGAPERVTAKRIGTTDSLTASFIYPGGPEVRLQGGWFEPGMPFSMSFHALSDRGALELTPEGLFLSDMLGHRNLVPLEKQNAYASEVHYFLECCRSGKQPERCPPADSAKAVKIALALKESRAKDGEQIRCLV